MIRGLWWIKRSHIAYQCGCVNNRGIDRDPASVDYGNPTFSARGATLDNTSTPTAYPITVKSSAFDGNSNHGLEIFSKGAVTLYGVSGSFNDGDGAHIVAKNSAVSVKNSVFDGNDVGNNVDEVGHGLFIQGNIATLDNVQTESNNQHGIYSENNTSFSGLHLHSQSNQWSGISVNTCLDYK